MSVLRLCLPVLLVLVIVAVPTTGAAAAEAPGHGGRHRVAPDCWKTVMETPVPCARDIIRTLVQGVPHLSKGCCVVLGQVGERCVVDVFSRLRSGAAYLPVVNRICGLLPSVVA
ncbi:hypothetical protein ZWY2020_048791 [Hordeum vulgare]|nr:hypothetical protein ZWY2020_048791 [Hordeum vulgare]